MIVARLDVDDAPAAADGAARRVVDPHDQHVVSRAGELESGASAKLRRGGRFRTFAPGEADHAGNAEQRADRAQESILSPSPQAVKRAQGSADDAFWASAFISVSLVLAGVTELPNVE